ncbi:hypothetical protein ABW19_dt0209268 [Dactylella cylindrospora]|nr:hypothetical protein ABW19_dt0209268 [Dactylella cylindrospora]
MELPETCLTNVFKIENLSEIPYSVYRISSTLGSAPAWRVLAKAETNLRRQGKCVTTCSETSELWLFQVESNETDVAFSSDSGYNSYDGSGTSDKGWEPMVWGLEEKIKEVMHVNEIFEILKPPVAEPAEDLLALQNMSQLDSTASPGTALDPVDLTGPHRDIFMLQQLSKQRGTGLAGSAAVSPVTGVKTNSSTHSTPRPHVTKPVSKQELVAQKCLHAVISLLSYRLANSFGWIPLNLCTFLPKVNSDLVPNEDILSYSPASNGPACITTLSVSLLDDGSIQVVPKTTPQAALQKFSDFAFSETPEEDIWLAPSGIIGRYNAKVANDSLSQATPEWKSYVLKSLSDRGIELEYPTNWARVNVWSDIEGLIEIYWPTSLIFIRKSSSSDLLKPTNGSLLGSPIAKSDNKEDLDLLAMQLTWYSTGDSLDFAATWLSSSSAREAERRRRVENRNKAPPAIEVDRKVFNTAPAVDRSGTIYPTPPDGVSGNDGHQTPGGQTAAPTPGHIKTAEETSTTIVGPPTAPATAEATVNSTDMDLDDNWMKDTSTSKAVDDEMFGDVQDVGMGGGDGLEDSLFEVTEEDFGFFDEIGGSDDFGDMGLDKPQNLSAETPARPTTSALSENMNDLTLGFNAMGSYADDKMALVDMDLDLDEIGAAMDQVDMRPYEVGPLESVMTQNLDKPSSQQDGQSHALTRIGTDQGTHRSEIIQVETPPYSPQKAIMKLLVLDPKSSKIGNLEIQQSQPSLARRTSLYSPVDFPSFVERSDEKYMAGGRFFCADDTPTPRKKANGGRSFSATFPRIKKYRNFRRPLNRDMMFLEDEEERSDLIPDTGSSDGESTTTDEYDSDDDEMFEVANEGDQEPSSYPNSLSPEGIRQGLKRKRNGPDYWGNNKVQGVEGTPRSGKRNDLDIATEWSTSEIGIVNDKDIDSLGAVQRSLCNFNTTDTALEGVFSFAPDNSEISSRVSPQDFSHIVSLLQEQVVWNTYLISSFSPGNASAGRVSSVEVDSNCVNDAGQESFQLRKQSNQHQDDIEDLLSELFGSFASRCSLETLVYGATGRPKSMYGVSPHSGAMEVQGISMGLTPVNRPKSSADTPDGLTPLFKIGAPHVHVHRNAALPNGAVELLPPALQFWDTFGLAPHSGPKDLLMACVFPKESGLANAARVYIDSVSSTYENCRLGESLNLKTSQIADGLHGVPLAQGQEKVQNLDEKTILRRYCEGISRLGETLVEIEDELQNVVLFIVNPFNAPSSFLDICVAFHNLKKTYVNAFNSSLRVFPNNIILQIVPIKNLAGQDGFSVQTHNQSIRCALEVYERCTQTIQDHLSQTFPQETYSPALVLTKQPPKFIAFKVSSDPSPAILQENMCLHMAYAQSLDERWVSVSWGDDCGEIKEIANFCLGIPGTMVLRSFDDICREIWAVTNKIISKKRIHWRISLVKIGAIDEEEIEVWTKLSNDCAIANTLTIFSSDPSPPMTFKSSVASLLPQAFNGQAHLVGTPGATPQSATVSPDQFGASSQGGALTPGDTPAPEIDNDIALVDFTDETWGAILHHPLNNSDSTVKIRPALASGYLIKRTGPNETDKPALLAVSLIRVGQRNAVGASTASPVSKSNEDVLREILAQYRGLVTLAQHFGVIDMIKEVLPWHIAAVVKCRDTFSCVL